jgi:hypothetical protein
MTLAIYFVGLLIVVVVIPALHLRETIRVRLQGARVSSRRNDRR